VDLFFGHTESNTALLSQVPGHEFRVSNLHFTSASDRLPSFQRTLRRYSGVMLALVAQSAACNRAHDVDQRCARWLLMTHDQARMDRFPITQEFLAQMMGVSRPAVGLSAAALQKAGLISYHRGEMTIVDDVGLERAACECYAVTRGHFAEFAGAARYASVLPAVALAAALPL
jgi:hypothetical protein